MVKPHTSMTSVAADTIDLMKCHKSPTAGSTSTVQVGGQMDVSDSDNHDVSDQKKEDDIAERIYTASDLAVLTADQQKRLQKKIHVTRKTYYPMQECLAENIVNRIKTILWFHSNKKILSDFSSFDFQIYTARYNTLVDQTLYRLLDPEASCFQRWQYADFSDLKRMAAIRMLKYQIYKKEDTRLVEIQERAKTDPDTLFLIIADEAHWGSGRADQDANDEAEDTKYKQKGANDQLINCWTNDHPNVIVLQVTATGFNLKSPGTSLPDQDVAVLRVDDAATDHSEDVEINHKYTRDARLVEKRHNIYVNVADESIQYTKDKVERIFPLHNIKWTEGHKDKIQDGMLVQLRVPHKEDEDYHWLKIKDMSNHCNLYSLEVTKDKSESIELLIEGHTEDSVEIKSKDGENQLVVVVEVKQHDMSKYELGFVAVSDLADWNDNNRYRLRAYTFSMRMECGEDLLSIRVNDDEIPASKSYLWFNRESNTICLNKPPVHQGLPNLEDLVPTYKLEYMFLIDYYNCNEQLSKAELSLQPTSGHCKTKFPPQYLSLNFLYNSMRNESREEQLIRGDEDFAQMMMLCATAVSTDRTQKKSVSADSGYVYLAADYSYYILLMEDLRNCTEFHSRSFQELLQCPLEALGKFNEMRACRIQVFVKRLDEYSNPKLDVISSNVFMSLLLYHSWICDEILSGLVKDIEKSGSSDLDHDDVFESLLNCLLYLNTADPERMGRFHQVYDLLSKNTKQLNELNKSFCNIGADDFATMKRKILEKSETYKIVNRLIQLSDQDKVLDGKMVVVRLPITQNIKEGATPPGNIFYATLCEARMAGMIDSSESFKFELVRDFGDYTLAQVADNVQTAQHRLHYQLQPEVCEHRDEATLQRCSSGHQGRPCSHLEIDEASKRKLKCENCHHRHRLINCYEDLNTLPCILILVSKGRLGDTFPDSFFAMDLRLTTEGKKAVPLSTIMQELGRLCRYTDKPSGPTATDEYLKLPYALIGQQRPHKSIKNIS